MLSTSNPIKAGSSGEYYREMARGEYYTGNGQAPGQWFGPGAKALGLVGKVEEVVLANLLEGRSPDGVRNLVQNAGSPKRQQGWDETFSAPKSVSVLWASAPALRNTIERAHTEAVQAALDYLNDRAGLSRRGKGGRTLEKASLLFATFLETVSRELDPQLHTHALALNVGVRVDGTTGALWSHELFVEKMAAGALYRAWLAANLRRDLGLAIQARRVGFDILGVPTPLCRDCSKRRHAIEAKLDEWQDHSAIAAKAATLATRPAKQMLPQAEVEARWQATVQKHGWTAEQAQALVGKPMLRQASAQELAAAVASEAQRLPVSRRNRKHVVRLAGELAVQLNAEGNALRWFYETALPRLLHSLNAKTPVQVSQAKPKPRQERHPTDDGERHHPSFQRPDPVRSAARSAPRRDPDEAEPITISRPASASGALRAGQSVVASEIETVTSGAVRPPQPGAEQLSTLTIGLKTEAKLNLAPAARTELAPPAGEVPSSPVNLHRQAARREGEFISNTPASGTPRSRRRAEQELRDAELPRGRPERRAESPGNPPPQDTVPKTSRRPVNRQASEELTASKPDSSEQELAPPPGPIAVVNEQRRQVRSVVHSLGRRRDALAELMRRHGVAQPEHLDSSKAPHGEGQASSGTSTVIRARKAETEAKTNPTLPQGQSEITREWAAGWRGTVERSASGTPIVVRARQAQREPRMTTPSRPVERTPARERQLREIAKAAGVLQPGMTATWSDKHGGVLVHSDGGLTLVRFKPAARRDPKPARGRGKPLDGRRKSELVELVKSPGFFEQADAAHRADCQEAAATIAQGTAKAMPLRQAQGPSETIKRFRKVFLERLEQMHPENRTPARAERLAFWVGRRSGLNTEAIQGAVGDLIPKGGWSLFRVESRPLFRDSPVPLLRRIRASRLTLVNPPRYWGKVRWTMDLFVCELRVQEKFLAPHSPTWSPVHKWRVPVLRFTTEKARLPHKQPSQKPEAERAPSPKEAPQRPTKQNQDRRPTMEHGY